MTTFEPAAVQRLPVWRRVTGVVIGLLLVAEIAAYVAAQVRPDLVVLRDHFANWLTGAGVMFAILFLGTIVVFPIRNPAAQRARGGIRVALIVVMALSFIFAAFTRGFNLVTYEPRVVATSPDGKLHAALVSNGRWDEIHVFTGSGLGQRDAGDVGAPCNLESIVFTSDSKMTVESSDDEVMIPLDPETGAPLAVLRRTCAFPGA